MFDRVKAYLIISLFMTTQISAACLFLPDTFKSHTYDIIEDMLPFRVWGIIFGLISVAYLVALCLKSVKIARIAGSFSASIMMAWGITFGIELLMGEAHGPTAFVVWTVLAAKDIVIISTPVVTPIEEYVLRSNRYSELD